MWLSVVVLYQCTLLVSSMYFSRQRTKLSSELTGMSKTFSKNEMDLIDREINRFNNMKGRPAVLMSAQVTHKPYTPPRPIVVNRRKWGSFSFATKSSPTSNIPSDSNKVEESTKDSDSASKSSSTVETPKSNQASSNKKDEYVKTNDMTNAVKQMIMGDGNKGSLKTISDMSSKPTKPYVPEERFQIEPSQAQNPVNIFPSEESGPKDSSPTSKSTPPPAVFSPPAATPSSSSSKSISGSTRSVTRTVEEIMRKTEQQYTYKNGRRIAGRQTETFPNIEGKNAYYAFSDAGKQLGPKFKGILIPKVFIENIKESITQYLDARKSVTENGEGNDSFFQLPEDKEELNSLMDMKLINKAIRETLGEMGDEDSEVFWQSDANLYNDDVLDLNKLLHDQFRARHYAGKLEYSEELHELARSYAKHLAKETSTHGASAMVHNKKVLEAKRWGENLYSEDSKYAQKNPLHIVKAAIEGWYNEKQLFTQWGVKTPNIEKPVTGHFTALVWRRVTKFGIGLARFTNILSGKTTFVYVVNYSPGGNTADDFDTNVLEENKYNTSNLPNATCSGKSSTFLQADMLKSGSNFIGGIFGAH